MKTASTILAGMFAILSVNAAAIIHTVSEPLAQSNPAYIDCQDTNGVCSRLKRAAVAAADAMAEADPITGHGRTFCYLSGEACSVAKRNALALAEAAASAMASADPHHRTFCYEAGEACSVAKRNALAAAEALAEAEAGAIVNPKASANEGHAFCHAPEGPCTKVKRAAKAIAEAIHKPEGGDGISCQIGEECSNHKRTFDELTDLVNKLR